MRVFVLEDDPTRIRWFRGTFFNHELTLVESCAQVEQFVPPYDLVCLDHDLGGRQVSDNEDNGATFSRLIADRINQSAAVAVHSYNSVGARRILAELSGTGVSAYLTPFRGPMSTAVIDAVISS